jgi:hypothetical protein
MAGRGAIVAFVLALAGAQLTADERDPIARARLLYNQGRWDEAIQAAAQARTNPTKADSAELIVARVRLERFRERSDSADLIGARDALRRLNPQRFSPRERAEFIVGLGEALYLDGTFGAAATVFESALDQDGALEPDRDRVLDWWATALDRDARPRTEFERQAIYARVRDRMQKELGATPSSTAAAYWLSAAARGQGDLQTAWDAAQAGWARASLAGDRANALRMDLDRLVLTALVPERARAIGQPPESLRVEWDRFKERWAGDPQP